MRRKEGIELLFYQIIKKVLIRLYKKGSINLEGILDDIDRLGGAYF